jgi:hypothetical protein
MQTTHIVPPVERDRLDEPASMMHLCPACCLGRSFADGRRSGRLLNAREAAHCCTVLRQSYPIIVDRTVSRLITLAAVESTG